MFALMDSTNCTDEPKLIGLACLHSVALAFVMVNPNKRSARFFATPKSDEITTMESVLDVQICMTGMAPGSTLLPMQDDDLETEDECSNFNICNYRNNDFDDRHNDPHDFEFEVGELGVPEDPVHSILKLCDEVKRYTTECDFGFDGPSERHYTIITQYMDHIIRCTTVLLSSFVSDIGRNMRRCPSRTKLLLLLLDGAVDTFEYLQAKYDVLALDEYPQDPLHQIVQRLTAQITEIQAAAVSCIPEQRHWTRDV